MSVNIRLVAFLPEALERNGFEVTLQSATSGAGGDFDDTSESWSNIASFNAVWDTSSGYGAERIEDARASSQSRLGMLIAYRDDLKDAAAVANKRISYNGSAFNIAAVQMLGDKVSLRLTLEDGTAQ